MPFKTYASDRETESSGDEMPNVSVHSESGAEETLHSSSSSEKKKRRPRIKSSPSSSSSEITVKKKRRIRIKTSPSSSSSEMPTRKKRRVSPAIAAKKIQGMTRKQQARKKIKTGIKRRKAAKKIQRITRKRQGTCPICLENFVHQPAFELKCGHKFHKPCIKAWMKAHTNCPLCKREIEPETIRMARGRRDESSSTASSPSSSSSSSAPPEFSPEGILQRVPYVRDPLLEQIPGERFEEGNFSPAEFNEFDARLDLTRELYKLFHYYTSMNGRDNFRILDETTTLADIVRDYHFTEPQVNFIIEHIKKHSPSKQHLSHNQILEMSITDDIAKLDYFTAVNQQYH